MTRRSELAAPPLSDETGLGPLTLPGYLADIVARHPDSEALCWTDLNGTRHICTYSEFLTQARALARALLTQGLGKNARVGLLASNRAEWLISAFGIAMAGGVTVALNTFSTSHELRHQLAFADIQLLIMEAGVASQDFVADIFSLCPQLATTAPGQLLSEDFPFLRRVICVDSEHARQGLQSWESFLASGENLPDTILDAVIASISPVDQGLIFFSSGSTALPKAILQSHRAAALQCWRFGKIFEAGNHSRILSANGFFFSGNFAQAVGALSGGGCLVLQRFFDPDKTLQLLQEERITILIAWPHQEARLQDCPGWDEADFSALRCVSFNSVFRSHPTLRTAWNGYQGHGMTETFTLTSATYGEDFRDGSFGPLLPGNRVRIVDPQSGDILPLGEIGEIIVKGPTTMMGYLKVAPEDTFDEEGFIHTDDAGYLGEDGHLYWKGRLGEIIKTGGANVSPLEIDDVISRHPAVQSCCTVGIPHATLGELVVACVVLFEGHSLDDDELRSHVRQYLAAYKVPRKVLFMQEEELPMTGSNKIRRSQLSEVAAERLATGSPA